MDRGRAALRPDTPEKCLTYGHPMLNDLHDLSLVTDQLTKNCCLNLSQPESIHKLVGQNLNMFGGMQLSPAQTL